MRKYSLYEYFYFTRAERNASIVLSCICIFFFALPAFYPLLMPADPPPDHEEFRQKIAPFIAQMEAAKNQDKASQANFRGEVENGEDAELFYFDPNKASKDELVRLGLSSRTAQTVLNYRNKGGQFKAPEDFKKLYTLRPEDYERLVPYISIPGQGGGGGFPSENTPPVELFRFDPNMATKDELVRLGLSPRMAQTVLNYRNKGGEFKKPEDFKKLYNLTAEDYKRLEPWISISANPADAAEGAVASEIEHFKFDPNTASLEDFVRLGLSEGTAKSIVNYRNKGGHFDEKEDFKKIYTLQPADYERLLPWMEFAEGETKMAENGKPRFEEKEWELKPIDVNTATEMDWEQFRGIGPGFAKRIVKFREELGGFGAIEQVAETYGLADSIFQDMKEYLEIPSGIYRKLDINKASLEELRSHPYLNKTQASILFNYRKQHGKFADMESLEKIRAGFKSSDWRRLEPYLIF